MHDQNMPKTTRNFRAKDAVRMLIVLSIFAIVGALYWFALPAVQSLLIPTAAGGQNGPWIVRPIVAAHFGAVAVMTAVTLSLILRPFQKAWRREDLASGSHHDPFHDRPERRYFFVFKAIIAFAIYASGFVFYLFSWMSIGPDGIIDHLPWATHNYSFQEIVSLERIPDGQRSQSIKQDGPWYAIEFRNGRSFTLSLDNEGFTQDELIAMTRFIADRSGLNWARRSDARNR